MNAFPSVRALISFLNMRIDGVCKCESVGEVRDCRASESLRGGKEEDSRKAPTVGVEKVLFTHNSGSDGEIQLCV